MKLQTDIDFDFKKIKNDTIELSKEENFSEVFLETVVRNLSTVCTYIIMSILILKITSIDLIPLSYILSKCILTVTAIVQALKYINKKSLKIQIFNGFLNTGILLYLFKFDGFLSLTSFLNQALSGLFI